VADARTILDKAIRKFADESYVIETVGGPIGIVPQDKGYNCEQIEELAALCVERMWPVPVVVPIDRVSFQWLQSLRILAGLDSKN